MEFKEQRGIGVELVRQRLKDTDRRLLYLTVSGSHVWGLDTPESDVDFRGVYQDNTMKVLGLHKGKDTIEFSENIYDVQLYELEKFLRMLCKHNGNMVNLLWIPNPIVVSFNVPWVGLAREFLTKKLRFYYRGYAEGQRKRAMSCRGGKALIYTYREMFSGLYTMRYGHLEFNFKKLWGTAVKNKWYEGNLLDKYFPDPTQEITDGGWRKFYTEWEQLCIKLDYEADRSKLPETFDGVNECSEILRQARLYSMFGGNEVAIEL